jgi:hypothetical protein
VESRHEYDRRLKFVITGRVLGPPRTERLSGGGQANEMRQLAVPLSAPARRKLRRVRDNPPFHLRAVSN